MVSPTRSTDLKLFLTDMSGKTIVQDESQLDIDNLADDLTSVLKEVFPERSSSPNLVLVGHSMVSPSIGS